ncbi:MAG: TetR/AcrR family transcriptional regulator [Acidimicrobiales bacterium]|jgi:AcrR family transcriptional regulator|nr:TetR/AcrR family transcriptional regulator [Acidimicrobiales bacterium]
MDGTDVVRRPPFGDNPLVGERGATTQRRILDATLEMFEQHGYHDTRVELITEAAGCSRPAFYQYFSGKDDVFWRLAAHMAKAMDALAAELPAIPADADGVEALERWLGELAELCTTYFPMLTSFQAASRTRARTARGSQAVGQRLGKVILTSFDAGTGGPLPPASDTVAVSVALRSIHYWRVGLGQLDRDRFLTGLARSLHRLLHGPLPGVNVEPARTEPAATPPKWPTSPSPDGGARPLRPRGQQTRQRLLDAASAILPICGYHDTRVDDIVEEAKVSHGSFYRYFASKDALFQVLAADAATQMVELLGAFPAGAGAGLTEWLERWFATYRDNGGIISAWQEIGQADPALAEFSLGFAAVSLDRLVRIVHQRGFGDAEVDALVLLAAIERVPYNVLVLGHLAEDQAVTASAFVIRRSLFVGAPA